MWKPSPLSATRRDRDQFLRFADAGQAYRYMQIFIDDRSRQFVSLGAKPDPPPCVKVHDENLGAGFV
jgi:hypothetical protein